MGSTRSSLPGSVSSNSRTGTPTSAGTRGHRRVPSQVHLQMHPQISSRSSTRAGPAARIPRANLGPPVFSENSSPAVPESLWYSGDFMLGAGMVVIQPTSGKVVILGDTYKDGNGVDRIYYFLPKGRKDVGESLEQAALREAYEESGMRVSFLPLVMDTHAPSPRGHPILPCTEPIFIHVREWSKGHFDRHDSGGEYLTFWYVGQIPENAVVESDTRMADEAGYTTYLATRERAMALLGPPLARIVDKAYRLWEDTRQLTRTREYQEFVRSLGFDPASLGVDLGDNDRWGDVTLDESEWVDERDSPRAAAL